MKCSLGISNFLKEISSLSHSIVFLYFFALITEEDFSYLSLLFFGTLHSNGHIFPFLLFLSHLKEMGITDHLICLLRNLYKGQEAPVRTGYEPTDWFQIRKRVRQGCILSPCLFNLYAEYIMRNTGLDEAQAGIKIARRNINNPIYADDTTLMAESKEELKSLLMKVESEKAGLKLNIQKTKIMHLVPSLHGK